MQVITDQENFLSVKQAILLYGNQASERSLYASVHPIVKGNVRAGEPLSREALLGMLYELGDVHGVGTVQWQNARTVASGPRLLVWWTPAHRQWVFLKESNEAERSGMVPLPALVWIAKGKSLFVYALKENTMPGPNTQLWQVPLFNVYEDGLVCQGNMPVGSVASTDAWEEGFFKSYFTHANPSNRAVSRHRQGNKGMWKRMFKDGQNETAEFPPNLLLPHKKTLGQVVK